MGAEEATYRPGGRNRFTVAELLAPLQASANRFAMDWRDPFLVYDAGALSAEDLAETGDAYRHALAHLAKPALAIPEKEGVQ
jgi:putative NADPH-quinone reductase